MKIAICIPVNGDTRALFTRSLGRMIGKTITDWPSLGRDDQPEIEIFMAESSLLSRNREALVGEAAKWSADWILWLDSDQTFPPESLLRLLAHNLPVVGCNYPRRHEAALPSAMIEKEGGRAYVWSTREKIEQGTIEPVSFMGFGVCLVSMAAIGMLEKPYFGAVNEDLYFFAKLRDAGFSPMIDHQLSASVGHLRVQMLTNDHSLHTLARQGSAPIEGKVSARKE